MTTRLPSETLPVTTCAEGQIVYDIDAKRTLPIEPFPHPLHPNPSILPLLSSSYLKSASTNPSLPPLSSTLPTLKPSTLSTSACHCATVLSIPPNVIMPISSSDQKTDGLVSAFTFAEGRRACASVPGRTASMMMMREWSRRITGTIRVRMERQAASGQSWRICRRR